MEECLALLMLIAFVLTSLEARCSPDEVKFVPVASLNCSRISSVTLSISVPLDADGPLTFVPIS